MPLKYNFENGKKIVAALLQAGAKQSALPYMLAQIAHETSGFNSRVFKSDNNASGIMFINKPLKQKNATRGGEYPKKESKIYHYAHFATLKDWAIDYLRIIGNLASSSKTLLDFATALRNRKYYTDTIPRYANGLKFHIKNITSLLNDPMPSIENNNNKNTALIVGGVILFAYFALS